MENASLIFPHQLFKKSPLIDAGHPVFLIEEYLYFDQFPFHKQKLALHRASMKAYEDYLDSKGIKVRYIEASDKRSDIRELIPSIAKDGVKCIHFIDPVDDWLSKRIESACEKADLERKESESPMFLNSREDLPPFFRKDKKKFHHTSFYKDQRKGRNILMEANDQPAGGKWTYDTENRKKYPKDKTPPSVNFPHADAYYKEAFDYVNEHYSDNPGELPESPLYAIDFDRTQRWFDQFLENRFHEFGPYEDAIVKDESILNHSVLTPMLNIGLITPQEIIDTSISFAEKNDVPIQSLEGFVRQIMGWREFIRGIYVVKGGEERTTNFWNFSKKIPKSFYTGETGIPPVDITIKKVLKTGYCHHIERLMVLGNFMLLCEFDPDEVYRWFMELFIDAYDWVMVPNVYGMSQFADGGLMSTKPYISSSNYLFKMSDYPKGDWQNTWDGLFWRFMHTHREFLSENARMGMLISTLDKMGSDKLNAHLDNAETFLTELG